MNFQIKKSQKSKILALQILLLIKSSFSHIEMQGSGDAVMVIEVIRHGARSATSDIMERDWTEPYGKGELTDVGKRQQYEAGSYTYSQFKQMFKYGMRSKEYEILSTDFERTIQSAYAHMLYILQNNPERNLPFKPDDQRLRQPLFQTMQTREYKRPHYPNPKKPLPYPNRAMQIHQNKRARDRLFFLQFQCPELLTELGDNEDKFNEEKMNTIPEYIKFIEEQKKNVFKLQYKPKFLKMKLSDQAFFMSDFVRADWMNSQTPLFVKDKDPEYRIWELIYSIGILDEISVDHTSKMKATGIFEFIIDNFSKRIDALEDKHPSKFPLKYILLSGHDSTLAPILQQFGMLKVDCLLEELKNRLKNYYDPSVEIVHDKNCLQSSPTASQIIFELRVNSYEKGDKKYSAGASYNGKFIDWRCNKRKICTFNDWKDKVRREIQLKPYIDKVCPKDDDLPDTILNKPTAGLTKKMKDQADAVKDKNLKKYLQPEPKKSEENPEPSEQIPQIIYKKDDSHPLDFILKLLVFFMLCLILLLCYDKRKKSQAMLEIQNQIEDRGGDHIEMKKLQMDLHESDITQAHSGKYKFKNDLGQRLIDNEVGYGNETKGIELEKL